MAKVQFWLKITLLLTHWAGENETQRIRHPAIGMNVLVAVDDECALLSRKSKMWSNWSVTVIQHFLISLGENVICSQDNQDIWVGALEVHLWDHPGICPERQSWGYVTFNSERNYIQDTFLQQFELPHIPPREWQVVSPCLFSLRHNSEFVGFLFNFVFIDASCFILAFHVIPTQYGSIVGLLSKSKLFQLIPQTFIHLAHNKRAWLQKEEKVVSFYEILRHDIPVLPITWNELIYKT